MEGVTRRLNVNLTGRERVTFRIREAASGKEYRVAKVMELGLGETTWKSGRVGEAKCRDGWLGSNDTKLHAFPVRVQLRYGQEQELHSRSYG